jgi:Papain family cysteine protease
MPPVRDQGQRGTCVAFAVTAAHEVSRGPASPPDDLSEDALYWGCKRVDGNWNGGTSFPSANTAIGRWGQPDEAEWPYDYSLVDGDEIHEPDNVQSADWYRSGLRSLRIALADLRTHLTARRPVVLGLTLFDTFFRPDAKGRVPEPPTGAPPRGRHAVLAVGYEPDSFLVRNSWSESWGANGYGWISDDYVTAFAGEAWVIDGGATPTGHHRSSPASRKEGGIYGTA